MSSRPLDVLHRSLTPAGLTQHQFATGSMGLKADAACDFVTTTGRPAAIGALGEIGRIVAGKASTTVEHDDEGLMP